MLNKIDNNALYNNIGLVEISDRDDGYLYLEYMRWSKTMRPNDVTYSLMNNIIDNGIYVGDGNKELQRNTFRFFNNCDVIKNSRLLKEMIQTSIKG